jgi:tetrahydromethanopterin S-methyltransferase subunit G
MNSSLIENLDSIKSVVSEINSRINKINTDNVNINHFRKASSRVSKKKSYLFGLVVILYLITMTFFLSYYQPWFVKKKHKFINVMNWWMVFFCNLLAIFIFSTVYAYLCYIEHHLLTVS